MGFSFYKKVTINTGQVPSSQSSFPALLPFLAGDNDFRTTANGGKATNASGFDIRPFSDARLTTALTFELATGTYNSTTGAFEMWVNITAVDGAVVYVAVGNPSLSTDGSSTATWSANYIGVWHMGNGSTLTLTDSTANAHTLTNNNTATAGTGKIGGAVSLASASTQFLSLASITPTVAMTMSAWINLTTLPSTYYGIIDIDNEHNTYVQSAGHTAAYFQATATQFYDPGTGTAMGTSAWHYVSFRYDSTNGLVGELDASNDGTATANGNLNTAATDMDIGADPATAGRSFNGLIDEAHIQNVAVSANWVTTEYNNQSAPATFWATGPLTSTFFNWEEMTTQAINVEFVRNVILPIGDMN